MIKLESEILFLEKYGIKSHLAHNFDILVLPGNIYNKKDNEELLDDEHSIELLKILKESKLKVAGSLDLKIGSKVIERRGDDFWNGVLLILNDKIFDIFIGILSAYIYDKIKNRSGDNKEATKDTEESSIHISITYYKTQINKLNYSGNIKDFIKILKSLKK